MPLPRILVMDTVRLSGNLLLVLSMLNVSSSETPLGSALSAESCSIAAELPPAIARLWALLVCLTDDWALDETIWHTATFPRYSAAVKSCSVDSPSPHPATPKDTIMIKGNIRVGVNSIPISELQLNSNSNSRIGIEIGGIKNGIETPGIGIENRNWIFCTCYRSTY